MRYSMLSALLALSLIVGGSAASAQGMFPGYPAASTPLTGSETIPADTNLSGGASPQTEIISTQLLGALRPTAANPTSTGTQTINLKTTSLYKVTLGANIGIGQPSNGIDGQTWSVLVTQDTTAGRTVTWDSRYFAWTGGTQPTVTTPAARVSRFDFIYNATTGRHYGVSTLNLF